MSDFTRPTPTRYIFIAQPSCGYGYRWFTADTHEAVSDLLSRCSSADGWSPICTIDRLLGEVECHEPDNRYLTRNLTEEYGEIMYRAAQKIHIVDKGLFELIAPPLHIKK